MFCVKLEALPKYCVISIHLFYFHFVSSLPVSTSGDDQTRSKVLSEGTRACEPGARVVSCSVQLISGRSMLQGTIEMQRAGEKRRKEEEEKPIFYINLLSSFSPLIIECSALDFVGERELPR